MSKNRLPITTYEPSDSMKADYYLKGGISEQAIMNFMKSNNGQAIMKDFLNNNYVGQQLLKKYGDISDLNKTYTAKYTPEQMLAFGNDLAQRIEKAFLDSQISGRGNLRDKFSVSIDPAAYTVTIHFSARYLYRPSLLLRVGNSYHRTGPGLKDIFEYIINGTSKVDSGDIGNGGFVSAKKDVMGFWTDSGLNLSSGTWVYRRAEDNHRYGHDFVVLTIREFLAEPGHEQMSIIIPPQWSRFLKHINNEDNLDAIEKLYGYGRVSVEQSSDRGPVFTTWVE